MFTALVIHHTAGNMSYQQILNEFATRREGYHRVIFPDGSVKSPVPIGTRSNGAYSERWAGPYINVSLVGAYHLRPVPAAQFEALVQTIAVLLKRYDLSPSIVTTHRQVGLKWGYGTACPGSYTESMLPYLYKRLYIYADQ